MLICLTRQRRDKGRIFGSFAWPSLLLSHLLPPTLHVNNQFNQLILLVHQTILIPICFLIGTLPRTEDCRNNRTALQTPHTIEPLEAASCLNSSQPSLPPNIMYFQLRRRKKKGQRAAVRGRYDHSVCIARDAAAWRPELPFSRYWICIYNNSISRYRLTHFPPRHHFVKAHGQALVQRAEQQGWAIW